MTVAGRKKTVIYYAITVWKMKRTVSESKETVFDWNMTVFEAQMTVFKGKVTVLECNMTVLEAKVTVLECFTMASFYIFSARNILKYINLCKYSTKSPPATSFPRKRESSA